MTVSYVGMIDLNYSYKASARPVEQRPRYREEVEEEAPRLITVDPRVCRGSTFRRVQKVPEEAVRTQRPYKPPVRKNRELDRGTLQLPVQQEEKIDLILMTEPYLTEVVEPPMKREMPTQTDEFEDLPPEPVYEPTKNGIDIETQVEHELLFDFNFEVQPIVATIVGKTLDQAIREVNEEGELEAIMAAKEAIAHQRQKEINEIKELEQKELQLYEEKQRKMEEQLKIEQAAITLRDKVTARGFSEFFVNNLTDDIIKALENHGYFYDEVERAIETEFLPWLSKEELKPFRVKVLTDAIIEKVLEQSSQYDVNRRESFVSSEESSKEDVQETRKRLFRQLLIEDLASHRIRTALGGTRRKVKQEEDEEIEQDDE